LGERGVRKTMSPWIRKALILKEI